MNLRKIAGRPASSLAANSRNALEHSQCRLGALCPDSMKRAVLFVGLFASTMLAAQSVPHNVKPAAGYVPDQQTAIRIAVAIWEPIYGREHIEGEKPYRATLKDGVWIVAGSLPKGWVGGVALAEISKKDGRILRVSHGR